MSDALKAFPVTVNWMEREKQPYVAYDFLTEREGSYTLELWCAPRNPVRKGASMGCRVSVNGEEPVVRQMILPSFGTDCGNQEWSRGREYYEGSAWMGCF